MVEKRLRITTAALVAGDRLQLCYDPQVLALKPEMPELVADNKRYSLWHKPAGMLAPRAAALATTVPSIGWWNSISTGKACWSIASTVKPAA